MRRAACSAVFCTALVACGIVRTGDIAGGGPPNVADASLDAAPPNDANAGCRVLVPPIATSSVDVELIVDRSGAGDEAAPEAGTTFWGVTQLAVTTFAGQYYVPNVNLGLSYVPFSNGPGCTPPAEPAVEIGSLPDNGDSIVASIRATDPGGPRPLGPAIAGAIAHMKAWGPLHPDREPVVAVLARGVADDCAGVSPTAAAAEGIASEPVVKTYVIALGSDEPGLDAIAKAGGTDRAFTIAGGDVPHFFIDAMLKIAGLDPGCEFTVPRSDGGVPLDPDLVTFEFAHSGTANWLEPVKVTGPADCPPNGGAGWYYEDPRSPEKIELCPVTCSNMPNAQTELVYGCAPKKGR